MRTEHIITGLFLLLAAAQLFLAYKSYQMQKEFVK